VTAQVNGTLHGHGDGGGRGFGDRDEAVSDESVAAKAIGITEAQLETALQGGQSLAAVAKSKGVDVQKVIDALVADANDELAAAVKSGALTQAQADELKANVEQRVTAQVNGTLHGHGDGGRHGLEPGASA
jgi:hypothetical protein